MTLTPYQIIVPLVSLVAVVYAWNLWYRQKKTFWETVLWTFFWGLIGLIALYPGFLTYLTAVTGIEDQVNAILVTCIGMLFFMVFYIIVRLEEMEQRQVRLLRKIALREAGLISHDTSNAHHSPR